MIYMVKQRSTITDILRALKSYYIYNVTLKNVSELYEIDPKTFYNWRKKYENVQITKSTTIKDLQDDNINEMKKALASLTTEIRSTIESHVINNPHFRAGGLVIKIKELHNVSISKSTLYRWLSLMNITYKKARRKIIVDVVRLQQLREEMRALMKKCISENRIILSIDEFGIQKETTPSKGWNKKGQPVEYNVKQMRYKRQSVVAIISKNGVVSKCIQPGSFNGVLFTDFIKKTFEGKKGKYALILDNAVIHRVKELQAYFKDNDIVPIFNIPYRPDCNPIEFMNNKVKNEIKRSINDTDETLIKSINDGFDKIKRSDTRGYFKKASMNLLKNEQIN